MSYNNRNVKSEDDDLKFIPLNVREPFIDKDSSWFPVIDLNLPSFSNIPQGFVLGFTAQTDNSNLVGTPLKTLDYVQSNNLNVKDTENPIEKKQFEEDFNLYYPSETLGEELPSYNKEDKCKKINTSTENINKNNINKSSQIQDMTNPQMQGMGNPQMQGINNPQMQDMTNINNQGMNSLKTQDINQKDNNINKKSMENRSSDFIEPIHMELLRNLDFESYLDTEYRGDEESKIKDIDRIFNIIKDDKSIVDTLKAYNLPKPIYDLIIKKIIKLTLENSKYKWGD